MEGGLATFGAITVSSYGQNNVYTILMANVLRISQRPEGLER